MTGEAPGADVSAPLKKMKAELDTFNAAGRQACELLSVVLAQVAPGKDDEVRVAKLRVVDDFARRDPRIAGLQAQLRRSLVNIWQERRPFVEAIANGALAAPLRSELISGRNRALFLLRSDAVQCTIRHRNRGFDLNSYFRLRNPLPGALTVADAQRWLLRASRERESG